MFIGREYELERLSGQYRRDVPSLVVIRGRRRIGKSRLVAEFAERECKGKFWSFTGIAPVEGVSDQKQRDEFSRQLSVMLGEPEVCFTNWSAAFEYLSKHTQPKDIVFFDEVSWMGVNDVTFIPRLKSWWDMQSGQIMLVMCSSVSIWVEENIIKSTALFGRINLTLTLDPFSIKESYDFLSQKNVKYSDYDMYKILCILGGIPWYLEQVIPSVTADENIKRLAFESSGVLVDEFKSIFYDLFNGQGKIYKQVLHALNDGAKTLVEVRNEVGFAHGGRLSQLIDNLIVAGFVQKSPLWSIKTGVASKYSVYRVYDPYMRFYLKMIEPNLFNIRQNKSKELGPLLLPGFDAHVGLQLEYLLLQNRPLLLKAIGISPIDVVFDGAYRQFANLRQEGCQVDYLIQTRGNSLYVCEFKFSRHELSLKVVNEMKKRVDKVKAPKGYAKVPVLFHLGEVADSVVLSNYFYRIIDIADFFR